MNLNIPCGTWTVLIMDVVNRDHDDRNMSILPLALWL